MFRLAVFSVFVLAVGCSKKDEKAASAPPPVAADAAAAEAPADAAVAAADPADAGAAKPAGGVDFEQLDHKERIKFMKEKVMPAMKPVFQKFDAKEFANFTCKTCHGKNPQKTKYEMPNKDLPALDFDAIKAGKEDPKIVEFMSKVVKPEMAKLLNMPEMTETEPKGFGCLHCHTTKKKKGA